MELEADDVSFPDDCGDGDAVVSRRNDVFGVCGDFIVGMNEVDVGMSGKASGNPVVPGKYELIPSHVGDFGMIQQERQNNIINILGGHSYAM